MRHEYASRQAQQRSKLRATRAYTAIFVGYADGLVDVNTGGMTVRMPFTGQTLPPPGYAVQVEVRDGQPVVTGTVVPLPDTGTILETGEYLATVTARGIDYELPYQSAYLPIVGDEVEITWTEKTGIIQGKVTAFPTPATPPLSVPVATGGSFHPAPFTAIDSGTHRGRWFTGDVYASASNDGAWFYGAKIADTIPDNATLTLARIYLSPRQEREGPPRLQLHTSATKPGGNVTFIGTPFVLPARSGFIDYLKSNGGGIGCPDGGYNIFRGVGSDGLSGALDLAWTTP
jgi:hypothetical protein